jgi:hypothetical protein
VGVVFGLLVSLSHRFSSGVLSLSSSYLLCVLVGSWCSVGLDCGFLFRFLTTACHGCVFPLSSFLSSLNMESLSEYVM